MYRYRIYTEAKNLIGLRRLIGKRFEAFTLYPVEGCWRGVREKSQVIEILLECEFEESIKDLCREIKSFNRQEFVLLTKELVFTECF